MRVSELLHSCSHDHVAAAAVASIGGGFSVRVQSAAASQNLTLGQFTTAQLRGFSARASERDWRRITTRMQNADLALLVGLEAVVTQMMETGGPFAD